MAIPNTDAKSLIVPVERVHTVEFNVSVASCRGCMNNKLCQAPHQHGRTVSKSDRHCYKTCRMIEDLPGTVGMLEGYAVSREWGGAHEPPPFCRLGADAPVILATVMELIAGEISSGSSLAGIDAREQLLKCWKIIGHHADTLCAMGGFVSLTTFYGPLRFALKTFSPSVSTAGRSGRTQFSSSPKDLSIFFVASIVAGMRIRTLNGFIASLTSSSTSAAGQTANDAQLRALLQPFVHERDELQTLLLAAFGFSPTADDSASMVRFSAVREACLSAYNALPRTDRCQTLDATRPFPIDDATVEAWITGDSAPVLVGGGGGGGLTATDDDGAGGQTPLPTRVETARAQAMASIGTVLLCVCEGVQWTEALCEKLIRSLEATLGFSKNTQPATHLSEHEEGDNAHDANNANDKISAATFNLSADKVSALTVRRLMLAVAVVEYRSPMRQWANQTTAASAAADNHHSPFLDELVWEVDGSSSPVAFHLSSFQFRCYRMVRTVLRSLLVSPHSTNATGANARQLASIIASAALPKVSMLPLLLEVLSSLQISSGELQRYFAKPTTMSTARVEERILDRMLSVRLGSALLLSPLPFAKCETCDGEMPTTTTATGSPSATCASPKNACRLFAHELGKTATIRCFIGDYYTPSSKANIFADNGVSANEYESLLPCVGGGLNGIDPQTAIDFMKANIHSCDLLAPAALEDASAQNEATLMASYRNDDETDDTEEYDDADASLDPPDDTDVADDALADKYNSLLSFLKSGGIANSLDNSTRADIIRLGSDFWTAVSVAPYQLISESLLSRIRCEWDFADIYFNNDPKAQFDTANVTFVASNGNTRLSAPFSSVSTMIPTVLTSWIVAAAVAPLMASEDSLTNSEKFFPHLSRRGGAGKRSSPQPLAMTMPAARVMAEIQAILLQLEKVNKGLTRRGSRTIDDLVALTGTGAAAPTRINANNKLKSLSAADPNLVYLPSEERLAVQIAYVPSGGASGHHPLLRDVLRCVIAHCCTEISPFFGKPSARAKNRLRFAPSSSASPWLANFSSASPLTSLVSSVANALVLFIQTTRDTAALLHDLTADTSVRSAASGNGRAVKISPFAVTSLLSQICHRALLLSPVDIARLGAISILGIQSHIDEKEGKASKADLKAIDVLQTTADRGVGPLLLALQSCLPSVRTPYVMRAITSIYIREKGYYLPDTNLLKQIREELVLSWQPDLAPMFKPSFHKAMLLAACALVHKKGLPVEVVLWSIIRPFMASELQEASLYETGAAVVNKCTVV